MLSVNIYVRLFIIALLLHCGSNVQAQKEWYNWYFGDHAGISFHTDPPTVLADSKIQTNEGVASISDADGNLLFYTDGSTIYNREHEVMQNGIGLKGHESSTMSATIVKEPVSAFRYYVFTVAAEGDSNQDGINYSIVDMRLDGGLGGVKHSKKNINLYSPTDEKLTIYPRFDGKLIWLITHERNNNKFVKFQLTRQGIKQHSIQRVGEKTRNERGYMVFSPNGNYLAMAHDDQVSIFNFNKQNGNITELGSYTHKNAYGLSFSPNSKLLYSATRGSIFTVFPGKLIQFSIDLKTTDVIVENETFGAMQIGEDKKIYVASGKYLSCIEYSDSMGVSCNFILEGLLLKGMTREGLPNIMLRSMGRPSADVLVTNNVCVYDTVEVAAQLIPKEDLIGYTIDFGDGR